MPQALRECAEIAQDLSNRARQLRTSTDPEALLREWGLEGDVPVTNIDGYVELLEEQTDPHRRRAEGEDV